MKLEKINKLSVADTAYALPLTHIPIPPTELYIKGVLPLKRQPTVAIIGSRHPTAYGKEITQHFASRLARRGVIIISGLALGIDAIAHQAALEAQGTTLAVLASGLHTVYPKSHTPLAKRLIAQGGALLSEMPPGHEARPYDFLARNRLISGLADAVLVVEAAEHSGTLSTASHALDQNKHLFAVPGPLTSLLSAGPNQLLQQGAHVALSAEDILRAIAPELLEEERVQRKFIFGDTPLEVTIIELLQRGIRDGDELLEAAAVDASQFLQTLTQMELKSLIYPLGGNRWAIKY